MPAPPIELSSIAPHGGSQHHAFEEFVCQLARRIEGVSPDWRFQRNGPGSDLGVECLWHLPNGRKRGWQAKFVHDIAALKAQATASLRQAIAKHPELDEYTICFPFVPSAAVGAGGTSQVTRLERHRVEWEDYAKQEGVSLRVVLWNASELASRLLGIDPHGGRRRYWFQSDVLTADWFAHHVADACAIAEPRYTPELSVEDGVGQILAAVGATAAWDASVSQRRASLEQALKDLSDSLRDNHPHSAIPTFPAELRSQAEELLTRLERMLVLFDVELRTVDRNALLAASQVAVEAAESLAEALAVLVDEEHGAGASASAAFRQYRTEYMVEFTTIHLDRLREIVGVLEGCSEWIASPEVAAASAGVLLVTGAAGTGKTHAVCDEAVRRSARGLPSVLTFGERFRSPSAWEGIRSQLGLSGEWSLDALLDALDAAGELAGGRLLLIVDALNETVPREFWKSELPSLVRSVMRRSHLGLCITCRSVFVSSTISNTVDLPQFEHNGFAGREFDACSSFFAHYNLDPPVGPLLVPEFTNPLMLKLTCEALVARGLRSIPSGWMAFRDVITARVERLNRSLLNEFGPAAVSAGTDALSRVVLRMADAGVRSLTVPDCLVAIGDSGLIPARDMLRRLVAEQFVHVLPGDDFHDLLSPPPERVAFSYERIGDHLIAQARLRRCKTDEDRSNLITGAMDDPGLFEALAVQLPEENSGSEILDLVAGDVSDALLKYWAQALSWRAPASIGDATGRWLSAALGRPATFFQACEAMLGLAVRPNQPLDARWMHERFLDIPLGERDSFWCLYLHQVYEAGRTGGAPAVVRLIDAAWIPRAVDGVNDDVAVLWLTVLLWFSASSDRRVRDRATRAAVKLAQVRPRVWAEVLPRFELVDDDYVLERAYLSCYGSLLRNRDPGALGTASECAAAQIVVTTNALVRDHCRAICELAERDGALPESVKHEDFRPPYQSQWPVTIPTESELANYRSRENRSQYPQLWNSILSDHMGDFACYTVPRSLRPFAHEVPNDAACRWIFQAVLDLGYSPERHARFDWYMVQMYGNGRGRPAWADRIGKKYQWIALARITGVLSDHVEPRAEFDSDPPPSRSTLAALGLRDLDPTTTDPAADGDDEPCWTGVNYSPSAHEPNDDEAWVTNVAEMRTLEDRFWGLTWRGNGYLPLEAHPKWIDRKTRPGDQHFRRQLFLQIRSYLTPCVGFESMWNWLRAQDIERLWRLPQSRHISEHVFLAEYPWATAASDPPVALVEPEQPKGAPNWLSPTAHLLGPEFEGDCSGVGNRSVYVPEPKLIDALKWNHRGGFEASDGRLIFVDPSFSCRGVTGCFFDQAHVEPWLYERGLSLFWTVIGERLPGTYRDVKRLTYGHIRGLHNGQLRSARKPVIRRS